MEEKKKINRGVRKKEQERKKTGRWKSIVKGLEKTKKRGEKLHLKGGKKGMKLLEKKKQKRGKEMEKVRKKET